MPRASRATILPYAAWRFPRVGPPCERALPWAVGIAVVIAILIP